jgi:mannose-6-phosphate isomerase-like protein (cupin superfamily)
VKPIEIDGQSYLVFEDTETGELYTVKAEPVETLYKSSTPFHERVVEEYYKKGR